MSAIPGSFGRFVADAAAAGDLVVQPRMGFCDPHRMRTGLVRTKAVAAATVGTLTVDSYTRVGDLTAARDALTGGTQLNGYPITIYPSDRTRALIDTVVDSAFPLQIRHGSSHPEPIIRALVAAGLDATEGGPAHIESFGGCMLGQLCPPGLLVALSLLEGLFFTQNGIRSVSLGYAQQTDASQDEEAIRALRRLAVRAGALRLVVKTSAEAHRIPTVEENVHALETAARTAAAARVELEPHETATKGEHEDSSEVYAQARTFVETTMTLSSDTGRALRMAFARVLLDIPYCLHPDNAGRSRSFIDGAGRLRWSTTGAMPVPPDLTSAGRASMTSDELLTALHYMARRFDTAEASPPND